MDPSLLFSSSALNNHQLSPLINWWWMKDGGICSDAHLLYIISNTVIWQWSKSHRVCCLFCLGSHGWSYVIDHVVVVLLCNEPLCKSCRLAVLVRVKIYQCFKFWQSILLCLLCNKELEFFFLIPHFNWVDSSVCLAITDLLDRDLFVG